MQLLLGSAWRCQSRARSPGGLGGAEGPPRAGSRDKARQGKGTAGPAEGRQRCSDASLAVCP